MNTRNITKGIIHKLWIMFAMIMTCGQVFASEKEVLETVMEDQKILLDGARINDQFGYEVAIDGERAIITAFGRNAAAINSGAAYIYEFDGVSWSQTAELITSDAADDHRISAVGIDGDRVILGAALPGMFPSTQTAYIFDLIDGVWTETAILRAPQFQRNAFFGLAVDVSGPYAVVGAFSTDTIDENVGAAYIFKLEGDNWEFDSQLIPDDATMGLFFGTSVDIEDTQVLIGAGQGGPNPANLPEQRTGAAYLYELNDGIWQQSHKFLPSDGMPEDNFSYTLSLDDNRAAIASINNQSSAKIYVFERENGQWFETAIIDGFESEALNLGPVTTSLELRGNVMIVGAIDDDGIDLRTGTAYVYQFIDQQWQQTNQLIASDGVAEDNFGFSVALSGQKLCVCPK